jgi:hypothetical protein
MTHIIEQRGNFRTQSSQVYIIIKHFGSSLNWIPYFLYLMYPLYLPLPELDVGKGIKIQFDIEILPLGSTNFFVS